MYASMFLLFDMAMTAIRDESYACKEHGTFSATVLGECCLFCKPADTKEEAENPASRISQIDCSYFVCCF